MEGSRWDDAMLDRMREVGDGPADEVVRKVFETGDLSRIRALFGEPDFGELSGALSTHSYS